MTAPERIWATEDAENFGQDRFHTTRPMSGLTEYIRADLEQEIVAEAVQWQPIETAPPARLLFYGHTRHDARIVFSGWKAQNGRLYADNGDNVKATHWMPLPAQPAAIRARGEGQPQEKG